MKLSLKDVQRISNRMSVEDSQSRRARLIDLERKVYLEDTPRIISPQRLKESIDRMYTREIERRRNKTHDLESVQYPTKSRVLTQAELDEAIQRQYTDAFRQKQMQQAKLDQKYHNMSQSMKESKVLTKAQAEAQAQRLSQPKKRSLTHSEINKILGL